jgi:hypothetical protein
MIGDFVYFIRAGQILARSRISGCRRMDVSEMAALIQAFKLKSHAGALK